MKRHWPEYLIEAVGLGLFMLAASGFGVLLFHPASPVVAAIPGGFDRNALMGFAMAITAIGLVYNRWGHQSGAHFNPAVTLTFWRLGRIGAQDALCYVLAQFLGGSVGMVVAAWLFAPWVGHPGVNYVVTQPGSWGVGAAWVAEFLLTFILMTVILTVSNRPRWARYTGMCAALCVFLFITVEAPVSGMSLNPARTFASAIVSGHWTALWVYFTAPLVGMLAGAQVFVRRALQDGIRCAKLHHDNASRCIFCEWRATKGVEETVRNAPPDPLIRV